MRDVKVHEIERVLDMYKYVRTYDKINSVAEFCKKYLERCECCGKIVFHDEIKLYDTWLKKECKCCEECQKEIKEDYRLEYV